MKRLQVSKPRRKMAVTRLDGVKQATVAFETATATVAFDDRKVAPKVLEEATFAAGFPASVTAK
jgi:copper chaperone CopZ